MYLELKMVVNLANKRGMYGFYGTYSCSGPVRRVQRPIWKAKEVALYNMQADFEKLYPSTRVITDTPEIAMENPSLVLAQTYTFSSYKNKITIIFLVEIYPKRAFSYARDCYGRTASDRSIMKRSALLNESSVMLGNVLVRDFPPF